MSAPTSAMDLRTIAVPRGSPGLARAGWTLLAVGAALCLASLAIDRDPTRFGFAYLWAYGFLWAVVLGSLFFVALQHITHSVWSVGIRRVAEMLAAPMWLAGLLFLPILIFGLITNHFHLFSWLDQHLVHADHRLLAKQAYLNVPFFTVRTVTFFILWAAFAAFFVGRSLRQDRGQAGAEATLRMRRLSVPFMPIFAVSVTFASIDWFMSLDPRWYSTIFGVYVFSGMVLTALAAVTIGVLWLRRTGRLTPGLITDDHLYNLGALLFAFSCFWAYIAFSQYMLIWYGNLPEETFYFVHRLQGGWLGISVALALARFGLPFLVLLSSRAKTHVGILWAISILVLAGQLLDLYWLIMPQYSPAGPVLGWQELGPPLLMIGVLLLYVARFIDRYPPVAVGDPLLEESRHFHL